MNICVWVTSCMKHGTSKTIKLLTILLTVSKKSVQRKWLTVEPPIIDDWIDDVYDIFVMENISYSLKVEKEKFYRIWSKRVRQTNSIWFHMKIWNSPVLLCFVIFMFSTKQVIVREKTKNRKAKWTNSAEHCVLVFQYIFDQLSLYWRYATKNCLSK